MLVIVGYMSDMKKPDRRLTADQARALTDEVKRDAAALWRKLLRLYEGGAHTALGYSSWGAFYETEFGESAGRGYQLLRSARIAVVLEANGCTDVQPPSSEAVARVLAPLLDNPERLCAVWRVVVAWYGAEPTAPQVRSVIEEDEPPGEDQPTPVRISDEKRRVLDRTCGNSLLVLDAVRRRVERGGGWGAYTVEELQRLAYEEVDRYKRQQRRNEVTPIAHQIEAEARRLQSYGMTVLTDEEVDKLAAVLERARGAVQREKFARRVNANGTSPSATSASSSASSPTSGAA